MLTPFNEDGTLKEKGLREVVRHNIDEMNVNGLYVGGSTGESFLMDESNRKDLLKIVKEEAEMKTLIAPDLDHLNMRKQLS
ncbi:dihydrodipicolinate synthase family protein [Lentibacillus sp. CBA3610]|uniref:dihydrodipicolinate synthase family protein n=1 Tax=Lentibacillus sp. CBA3610 TaxID=2518176 RepID=UPI001595DD26|nr:dihydrodipicolinate synthase family protein [Lentibacillus sp. CBA3610]QKY70775.1 hypothetical protein Len3610_15340 [Lentibacillus sp. CBA3610]